MQLEKTWNEVRGDRLVEIIGHFSLPIVFVGHVPIPELEVAVQTELLARLLHLNR